MQHFYFMGKPYRICCWHFVMSIRMLLYPDLFSKLFWEDIKVYKTFTKESYMNFFLSIYLLSDGTIESFQMFGDQKVYLLCYFLGMPFLPLVCLRILKNQKHLMIWWCTSCVICILFVNVLFSSVISDWWNVWTEISNIFH